MVWRRNRQIRSEQKTELQDDVYEQRPSILILQLTCATYLLGWYKKKSWKMMCHCLCANSFSNAQMNEKRKCFATIYQLFSLDFGPQQRDCSYQGFLMVSIEKLSGQILVRVIWLERLDQLDLDRFEDWLRLSGFLLNWISLNSWELGGSLIRSQYAKQQRFHFSIRMIYGTE